MKYIDTHGRAFKYPHTYSILSKEQKWKDYNVFQLQRKKAAEMAKAARAVKKNANSSTVDSSEENHGEMEAIDKEIAEIDKREIGVKAAKAEKKRKAENSPEKVSDMLVKRMAYDEEQDKKLLAEIEKSNEIAQKNYERAQMQDDMNIMKIKLSDIDDPEYEEYIRIRKAQIMERMKK